MGSKQGSFLELSHSADLTELFFIALGNDDTVEYIGDFLLDLLIEIFVVGDELQ